MIPCKGGVPMHYTGKWKPIDITNTKQSTSYWKQEILSLLQKLCIFPFWKFNRFTKWNLEIFPVYVTEPGSFSGTGKMYTGNIPVSISLPFPPSLPFPLYLSFSSFPFPIPFPFLFSLSPGPLSPYGKGLTILISFLLSTFFFPFPRSPFPSAISTLLLPLSLSIPFPFLFPLLFAFPFRTRWRLHHMETKYFTDPWDRGHAALAIIISLLI